jgi:ERCC4-type nuclease
MINITMDKREPATLRASLKKRFKERVIFNEQTLVEGDFLISDCVIVERKRIDDLYSSIMDGRLKSQCCRLTTNHAGKLIVVFVHGSLEEYAKEQRIKRKIFIKSELVFHALSEIMCSGILVVWSDDKKNGAETLINFICDISNDKWMVPFSCDSDLLMAKLLKINKVQMNELLKAHGSLAKIAAASPTSFTKIKGIGDKKAAYIKSVLNGR